jgi:uncharacterized protein YegP (UPF0339 family)
MEWNEIKEKFEFYQDNESQWKWIRKDTKGNVIAQSRLGFDSRELCEFNAEHYCRKYEIQTRRQIK